jgi:cell division protein FtsW
VARISLGRAFSAESSNYVMLLGITLFMVVFGLVMVLSSSSVDSHAEGQNFFARFWSQGMYAVIGVPLMLVVSRIPVGWWRRLAWPAMIASCALQFLVVATPLGVTVNGNRNWLEIGPVQFQPSEGIKIAMIIWMGMFLAMKQDKITQWRYSLIPVLLVTGIAIGLVLAGGDLGTTIIMASIVLGALFFAGIPVRHLFITGLAAGAVAAGFILTSENRMARFAAFFQPHTVDVMSEGWQIQQGNFALASGGIFGVGLGNSHAKWNWLPEADTDFIFAIIGEELGLIGAIVVLALFILLAVMFLRIIHANDNQFVRVVTAAIMVWLIGQGLVNIAVVLGVLPVLGVPLPLISAGGTALISSLLGIGIVLSFARANDRAQGRSTSLRRSRHTADSGSMTRDSETVA